MASQRVVTGSSAAVSVVPSEATSELQALSDVGQPPNLAVFSQLRVDPVILQAGWGAWPGGDGEQPPACACMVTGFELAPAMARVGRRSRSW